MKPSSRSAPSGISDKPKQSCAPGIAILVVAGAIWFLISLRCQEVSRIQAESDRQAQSVKFKEAHEELIRAEEHAKKFATPITSEAVPDRVEGLLKEELRDRFVFSSATYDSKSQGWEITVKAKVVLLNRSMLQQEMLESLSICAPKGMAVSSFTMTYLADFSDGLGHNSERPLITCITIPKIIDKIDWGDKGLSVWPLKFDKIFNTIYCHSSFNSVWADTSK